MIATNDFGRVTLVGSRIDGTWELSFLVKVLPDQAGSWRIKSDMSIGWKLAECVVDIESFVLELIMCAMPATETTEHDLISLLQIPRRSLDGGANGYKYDSTTVPHTVTMYSVTVPLCTAGMDTASLKEASILQKLRFA